MVNAVKSLVLQSSLGEPVSRILIKLRQARELIAWFARGRPVPPPHIVKRNVVIGYGQRYSIRVLIETGTFTGEMVEACRSHFNRIYSIELDSALADAAKLRFGHFAQISILEGDSALVLFKVLDEISEPAIFWLDAHFSGGITALGKSWSPVLRELEAILCHRVRGHVVLIDDARGFAGPQEEPTIEDLRRLVAAHRPEWCFEIRNDIIRTHGRQKPQPIADSGGD